MKQTCKHIVIYGALFFLGSAISAMVAKKNTYIINNTICHEDPFLHHCIIRRDTIATKVALGVKGSGRIHDDNVRWLYKHLRENDFDSFFDLLASPCTDPDANLGASGKTAMGLAYQHNFDDKFILEMNEALEELKPLLVFATMHQKYAFVEALLNKGVRTDARDEKGNTAMHYAAQLDDIGLIAILVKHKARLNIQNDDGITPLHVAACEGKVNALEQLLSYKKTACNTPNNHGDTPLHMVIKNYPKHRQTKALMTFFASGRFDGIPDGKGRSIATLLKTYLPAGHKLRILAEEQDITDLQKTVEQLDVK